MAHEDWTLMHQHYHKRRKALLNDWSRHRLELLNRAKVVFAESKVNQELATTKAEYLKTQKELCDILYAKVSQHPKFIIDLLELNSLSCT